MKRRITILVSTLAVLVVGIIIGSMMYEPPTRKFIVLGRKGGVAETSVESMVDPGIVVKAAEGVVVDDSFVSALRSSPINQARLDIFAPMLKHERIRLVGWDYKITSVTNNGDSMIGTVTVMPHITISQGTSLHASGSVREVYELRNNQLTFVETVKGSGFVYVMNP